ERNNAMASSSGQTPDTLIEALEKRPFTFDFYRAVRLLQSQFPKHARIGCSFSPSEDPVRFAQSASLIFAPSTLEALRHSAGSPAPRLFVRHFGLLGPNGPMPLHFTEHAYERQLRFGDHTLAGFLNIFH